MYFVYQPQNDTGHDGYGYSQDAYGFAPIVYDYPIAVQDSKPSAAAGGVPAGSASRLQEWIFPSVLLCDWWHDHLFVDEAAERDVDGECGRTQCTDPAAKAKSKAGSGRARTSSVKAKKDTWKGEIESQADSAKYRADNARSGLCLSTMVFDKYDDPKLWCGVRLKHLHSSSKLTPE
eukprot:gene17169-20418_t